MHIPHAGAARALILAGLLGGAAPGAPARADDRPSALLRDWEALNAACRGGSGDDPRTQEACARRDELDRRLAAAGWCYGRPGDLGYQRAWRACRDGAFAGAATLVASPQGAERRALLDAARPPAEAALRQPVQFVVHALNRDDRWAFLYARMQRPGGGRIVRPRDDGMSDDYAALLRREGAGWRIVATAVGPTDVAWEDWGRRYGAPAAVFAVR
jgi:hypothetical protein